MKTLTLTLMLLLLLTGLALARVNINTADRETLATLPGIGQARAEAIIKDRKDNGPYQSVDQLTRVKGIGDKMLEKIRNEITVKDEGKK